MLRIKKYQETILREEVVSYICDVCHKEFTDSLQTQEFHHIRFVGGYSSIFGDEMAVEADLCQHCLEDLLGKYLRVYDYHSEEGYSYLCEDSLEECKECTIFSPYYTECGSDEVKHPKNCLIHLCHSMECPIIQDEILSEDHKKTIHIHVHRGCVSDVQNIPQGYDYIIEDHD